MNNIVDQLINSLFDVKDDAGYAVLDEIDASSPDIFKNVKKDFIAELRAFCADFSTEISDVRNFYDSLDKELQEEIQIAIGKPSCNGKTTFFYPFDNPQLLDFEAIRIHLTNILAANNDDAGTRLNATSLKYLVLNASSLVRMRLTYKFIDQYANALIKLKKDDSSGKTLKELLREYAEQFYPPQLFAGQFVDESYFYNEMEKFFRHIRKYIKQIKILLEYL